jgi:hypothetical protein
LDLPESGLHCFSCKFTFLSATHLSATHSSGTDAAAELHIVLVKRHRPAPRDTSKQLPRPHCWSAGRNMGAIANAHRQLCDALPPDLPNTFTDRGIALGSGLDCRKIGETWRGTDHAK